MKPEEFIEFGARNGYGPKRFLEKYVKDNPKDKYESKDYGLVDRPSTRRMHFNNLIAERATGGRLSKRGS